MDENVLWYSEGTCSAVKLLYCHCPSDDFERETQGARLGNRMMCVAPFSGSKSGESERSATGTTRPRASRSRRSWAARLDFLSLLMAMQISPDWKIESAAERGVAHVALAGCARLHRGSATLAETAISPKKRKSHLRCVAGNRMGLSGVESGWGMLREMRRSNAVRGVGGRGSCLRRRR